jgi:hypothetical protein
VSHDEAYINRVIYGLPTTTAAGGAEGGVSATADAMASATAGLNPTGELWVLSHNSIRKHEGTFKEYKKQVLKKMKNIEEMVAASSNA